MSSFFSRNQDNLAEDAAYRDSTPASSMYDGRRRLGNTAEIDVDRIDSDPQHREEFEEEALKNLAESIRQHGQLQPIRVRWDDSRDRYIIIAGERRWRASKLAGQQSIQCVVIDGFIDSNQILREQIIENAIREDLKPTEKAKAYRDLMDAEGWNGKELAEQLQLVPSTVSRVLNLLKLPESLQQAVDAGELSIKDAIKQGKQVEQGSGDVVAMKRKAKPGRERKMVINGVTIAFKARKILHDELVIKALKAALSELEGQSEQVSEAA